jgi:DNA-binding response OmpR family regulator
MHILVVEDERKVASFIKRGLEAADYSVDVDQRSRESIPQLMSTTKRRKLLKPFDGSEKWNCSVGTA